MENTEQKENSVSHGVSKLIVFVTFAAICLLGVTLYSLVGSPNKTPEEVELEKAWRLKDLQATADEVMSRIKYIKDPQTELCFAHYWAGPGRGGPSITNVPCEKIPSRLLAVGK